MDMLFNPMAMDPARRGKIIVNYCFKSSREINETLRALCWLKRSLPTFNRLFNHTQQELSVFFLLFFSTHWQALCASTQAITKTRKLNIRLKMDAN